jgi:S-DNA-T family DNA segregation ATPase FtsK/SpoIIIE
MPRRRGPYGRRRSLFKLKLRKKTVYTLFALGLLGFSAVTLVSFTDASSLLAQLHKFITALFGWGGFFLPVCLFFLGLLFTGMRARLARANISLGFTLIWISLLGMTQAGLIGAEVFKNIADLITGAGALLVFIGGLIVGLVVFFNMSIGEIVGFFVPLFQGIQTSVKKIFTALFTKKPKQAWQQANELKIRGADKIDIAAKAMRQDGTKKPDKQAALGLGSAVVANLPKDLGIWEYPPLSLLSDIPGQKADRGDLKGSAAIIEKTLSSFGILARVVEVNLGPAVTQYALEIALGTKLSKIMALSNDLALALAAPTGQIRIEAPIPGRALVGIEIPNRSLEFVTLKKMLASPVMQNSKSKLTVALGLDVSGNPVVADLAKMPHILIAGTTGSGKSVLLNSFIASMLFRTTPSEVKVILIDPKRVEMVGYNGIPHLLTPVIVDVQKILSALKWAMSEMDRRYKIFAEAGVRNIDAYNNSAGFQALPYIIIIIDELADLMAYAPVEVEDTICRLAQMARATGIHLVLATQRPSVDVITGLIKANIPSRIAFSVSSMVDSRVILDTPGAEKLLGRGDMLYIPPDQAKPSRIQGTYVSEEEINKVVKFLKDKGIQVEYTEEVTTQRLTFAKKGGGSAGADGKDDLFQEAIRIVCQFDRASASLLQRKLSVGYARAARIIDQLEEVGVIGPGEGAKPRDVLVRNAEEFLASLQAETAP